MMQAFSGFDIIGDVHGCYGSLCRLLDVLGYERARGSYRFRDRRRPRQALFLGDLIDRGPGIRETALLVQEMVASGHAQVILGNHEHHAVLYTMAAEPGSGRTWLREHTERNTAVLEATLEQFANHSSDWRDLSEWLRRVPLLLDFQSRGSKAPPAQQSPGGPFRLIHACWDDPMIKRFLAVSPDATLSDTFWRESGQRGTFAAYLVYRATSGLNLRLPEGRVMTGRDNVPRTTFRCRFWAPEAETFGDLAFQPDPLPADLGGRLLDEDARAALVQYPVDAPPLFVGHYWLEGAPQRLTPNIACLDYSAVKGGRLVAYRMDGELTVDDNKFVWVDDRF